MTDRPWLHIIGIGEDGLGGLSPAARSVLETAEVIIGGDRHHQLSDGISAERLAWPSPFDALVDEIKALRGKRLAILATGDPLWYSVGARLARALPSGAITFHPQISAFQLAACRLAWSLADVETLTVHGRPVEQIIPHICPGARLLVLTQGAETPGEVARILTERGYAQSRLTVLANLGGPEEAISSAIAETWSGLAPDFHVLAVECVAGQTAQVTGLTGLSDEFFQHDGKLTKREVRSLTLARLMPRRGQVLWDIGAGSGAIGIEWLRAARDGVAIGIEPNRDQRANAATNAARLGAPRLELVEGSAPDALAGLPAPDAVFIGGGLSSETALAAMEALRPHGRLVANAVTLEREAVLTALYTAHGGDLTRIAISRASPVGRFHGWRPAMPVTQWCWTKGASDG